MNGFATSLVSGMRPPFRIQASTMRSTFDERGFVDQVVFRALSAGSTVTLTVESSVLEILCSFQTPGG